MCNLIKEYFKVDKSAYASIRGFYYQHLVTVEIIIEKFINGNGFSVSPESMNDIDVESDGELVLYQVKSYDSDLYFNSSVVRKALVDFLLVYILEKSKRNLKFVFLVNSSIKSNDKILTEWITNKDDSVQDKVLEYIKKEVTKIRDKRLEGVKESTDKTNINNAHDEIIKELQSNFSDFYSRVNWETKESKPYVALNKLENRIKLLLNNTKFGTRNIQLLYDRFLVLVYEKSTKSIDSERTITEQDITNILQHDDKFLSDYLAKDLRNRKLLALKEFQILKNKIIPKKTHPDMDWDDACWEIAIDFKRVEDEIEKYILNRSDIIPVDARKDLEYTLSLCRDGNLNGVVIQGIAKDVNNFGYDCADKAFNLILKVSDKLDKNLG